MKILRKAPNDSPLVKDTIGTGRKFLEDIMSSIDNQKLYQAVGISANTSYVLSGEAGTGKTFAVEALNNQYNQQVNMTNEMYDRIFYKLLAQNEKLPKDQRSSDDEIGEQVFRIMNERFGLFMYEYTIGNYGTAFINQSSVKLQEFFNAGIRASKLRPTVLVFDEADALMGQRGNGRSHNEDAKALQTIMTNLQEIQDNHNLYVILMTNFPRAIDKAVMRAGRINKRYEFKLPDKATRKILIQSIIKQRNAKAGYQVVRNYNLEKLAEMTEGFTNADLDQVIKESIRKRVREVARERNDKLIPALYVNGSRVERAISKHVIRFKLKNKQIGFTPSPS